MKFYRFNTKPSNLGKSSSSTNSVTVSRNRLITPNVPNYSGDQGSSLTKSSTTPQASTSFKVVGKNKHIFCINSVSVHKYINWSAVRHFFDWNCYCIKTLVYQTRKIAARSISEKAKFYVLDKNEIQWVQQKWLYFILRNTITNWIK